MDDYTTSLTKELSMKDSILLENARREIARLGGIQQPEAQPSASRQAAWPHSAIALPHVPIALPHWAVVNGR